MTRELKRMSKDASVHEATVQKVATGEVKPARRKRAAESGRTSRVRTRQAHPALKMAHDLGIDPARVEPIGEPPSWSAVIHNDATWRKR